MITDLRQAVKRVIRRPKPRAELHDFWRKPNDGDNRAEDYLTLDPARSEWLVRLFNDVGVPHSASVLEIGCNAGRNLAHLHQAGWTDLHAVEISDAAVDLFREHHPSVAADTNLHVGPAETVLAYLDGYDLVFTMAVLEHFHWDSDHLMTDVARLTRKWLVTVEDERSIGERHFGRNYGRVFSRLGLVEVMTVQETPPVPLLTTRVFERR